MESRADKTGLHFHFLDMIRISTIRPSPWMLAVVDCSSRLQRTACYYARRQDWTRMLEAFDFLPIVHTFS